MEKKRGSNLAWKKYQQSHFQRLLPQSLAIFNKEYYFLATKNPKILTKEKRIKSSPSQENSENSHQRKKAKKLSPGRFWFLSFSSRRHLARRLENHTQQGFIINHILSTMTYQPLIHEICRDRSWCCCLFDKSHECNHSSSTSYYQHYEFSSVQTSQTLKKIKMR